MEVREILKRSAIAVCATVSIVIVAWLVWAHNATVDWYEHTYEEYKMIALGTRSKYAPTAPPSIVYLKMNGILHREFPNIFPSYSKYRFFYGEDSEIANYFEDRVRSGSQDKVIRLNGHACVEEHVRMIAETTESNNIAEFTKQ